MPGLQAPGFGGQCEKVCSMISELRFHVWHNSHVFYKAACSSLGRIAHCRKWLATCSFGAFAGIFLAGVSASVQADVVWHCSRGGAAPSSLAQAPEVPEVPEATQGPVSGSDVSPWKQRNDSPLVGGRFANFDLSITDLIELELSDIYGVYSGETISMGPRLLSACFIRGNSRVHRVAMDLVGIAPSSVEALSKASAIVKSRIYPVADEDQMQICIEKHHPAIGYLTDATVSDGIAPCF